MRLKHRLGSTSNSAANSAAGPVLAPRIPLPAASPNCRQQYDLSMIITLRRCFSGRSEEVLPVVRGIWSALRKELIGEQTDRCGRPSRHGRHALPAAVRYALSRTGTHQARRSRRTDAIRGQFVSLAAWRVVEPASLAQP